MLFVFRINPITGRYEEPKSNPLEGMSDEQKEHEAMELVKHIDKLQRLVVDETRGMVS